LYTAFSNLGIFSVVMINSGDYPVCNKDAGTFTVTSSRSFLDAQAKADMAASKASLALIRECNTEADFAGWAEVWGSSDVSRYLECPCGWTPVFEYITYEGEQLLGYTTADANRKAWDTLTSGTPETFCVNPDQP
jgi:hypothetical protein